MDMEIDLGGAVVFRPDELELKLQYRRGQLDAELRFTCVEDWLVAPRGQFSVVDKLQEAVYRNGTLLFQGRAYMVMELEVEGHVNEIAPQQGYRRHELQGRTAQVMARIMVPAEPERPEPPPSRLLKESDTSEFPPSRIIGDAQDEG